MIVHRHIVLLPPKEYFVLIIAVLLLPARVFLGNSRTLVRTTRGTVIKTSQVPYTLFVLLPLKIVRKCVFFTNSFGAFLYILTSISRINFDDRWFYYNLISPWIFTSGGMVVGPGDSTILFDGLKFIVLVSSRRANGTGRIRATKVGLVSQKTLFYNYLAELEILGIKFRCLVGIIEVDGIVDRRAES